MPAIDPDEFTDLSALLEQALELAPAEREAWLRALPAGRQGHVPALRAMLERAEATRGDGFLAAVPRLLADETVARADDAVGPYRLLREVGRGGMGSVWLAERADGSFKRQVALKLPRLAWGAGLGERMARERDIGAMLEHPHIARLYDAGVDERGRPYLALEYIEGQPIDAWCRAQGLDVRARLRLFVQVARAVAYAHARLVVHRDLKPSNVLVTADGQAHLLDFGIAKLLLEAQDAALTQGEARVLTPNYASPEQVAGETITVQSDVYSLGVLLYELLTGSLPRRPPDAAWETGGTPGVDDVPWPSTQVADPVARKALRGEVDAIVGKALRLSPAQRYATADALAQDIERHLAGEPVSARPPGLVDRLRKSLRRHALAWTVAVSGAALLLGGAVFALLQAQREARTAERETLVKAFVAEVFRASVTQAAQGTASAAVAPARSLIDGGTALIEERFRGQPALQAELFGVVGGVFADMGAWPQAGDHAQRRLMALQASEAPPREQRTAALALAQALMLQKRFAEAEPHLRAVREATSPSDEQHLRSLVLEARALDGQSRPDALEQAVGRLEALLPMGPTADSPVAAWALFLRGRVDHYRNRFEKARPQMEAAIAAARAREGPLSVSAAEMQLDLAQRLVAAQDRPRAQRHHDEAVTALHQRGGGHRAHALLARAQFLHFEYVNSADGTHFREVVERLGTLRAELQGLQLPLPPQFASQFDFWRGDILVFAGDVSQGWPLLARAGPVLLEHTFALRDRRRLLASLASAAGYAGETERSLAWGRSAMELMRQEGLGRHPWLASAHIWLAQVLMFDGRWAEAEAMLDAGYANEGLQDAGPAATAAVRGLLLQQAQLRLAQGRPEEALRLLGESVPNELSDVGDAWRFQRETVGEALCLGPRVVLGWQVIQAQLQQDELDAEYPDSPWMARLRAVAGRCALKAGLRAQARLLAQAARRSLEQQPAASPYYKAPLRLLEAELGLHLPAL